MLVVTSTLIIAVIAVAAIAPAAAANDRLHGVVLATDFTKARGIVCLKPENLLDNRLTDDGADNCALACRSRVNCNGFRLVDADTACQLFLFDKCSHDVNTDNCDRPAEEIFIRNQGFIEPGHLCPAGYGYRRGSSVYKTLKVNSWMKGNERCLSSVAGGLTKYADAYDADEVEFLQAMKYYAVKEPFYIGGYQFQGKWAWIDCPNAAVSPRIWAHGARSRNDTCCAVISRNAPGFNARTGFNEDVGIEDTDNDDRRVRLALCECVDPFDIKWEAE